MNGPVVITKGYFKCEMKEGAKIVDMRHLLQSYHSLISTLLYFKSVIQRSFEFFVSIHLLLVFEVHSLLARESSAYKSAWSSWLIHRRDSSLGAVTLDLLPMGNLRVTAWVGFTLGYDRLPVCGYTLVNYPRGR